MKKLLVLAASVLLFSSSIFAHSGRTNGSGCHNNNKTGGYHCHGGGSSYTPSYSSSSYTKPTSSYSSYKSSYTPSYKSSSDVWVNGYYRSNGTYVNGHYRSKPDGDVWNNWSTYGNVNPYTGKVGTKKYSWQDQKYRNYSYESNYESIVDRNNRNLSDAWQRRAKKSTRTRYYRPTYR